MSEWTENWTASNSSFVNKNKDVEKVLERRRVTIKNAPGYIYTVRLVNGSFEVRTYANGSLVKKTGYPTGVKAVFAYRILRDTLVKKTAKTPAKTPAKKGKK